MKRSLKALLVSAAVVASLVGSAAPASAETCIGFYMDQGLQYAGYWQCDECPNPSYYGPLDGRWYLVLCERLG
ncbi:MAG: hypothetical protein M3279_10670 [Actinomycetota bacterium]|nr:hypothetical protein [Actinomycetota bacterium]